MSSTWLICMLVYHCALAEAMISKWGENDSNVAISDKGSPLWVIEGIKQCNNNALHLLLRSRRIEARQKHWPNGVSLRHLLGISL